VSRRVVFEPFELDVESGRLTKHGRRLKVVGQPVEVLSVLLERAGEVVTRDELRARLWPADTFVDFEHGLNAAVNKLRFALGDSADRPRYIETVPRRGYRFIAAIERQSPPASTEVAAAAAPSGAIGHPWRWLAGAGVLGGGVLLAALLAGKGGVTPSDAIPQRRTMLVVLPFGNPSGDQDQEYFAEGLTDEMIALLGRIDPSRVGVIARTSATYYAGGRWRVRQIAEELGVDYVLDGSVRQADGRVRVTAQLVRGSDEAQVWSQVYERDLRDLFAVQHELASAIADRIEVTLPGRRREALARGRLPTPEAYEVFLRGRHLLGRNTVEAIRRGHEYLQESVRLDPGFALAHAGLSDALQRLAHRVVPPAEAMPLALEAARRSLALEPDLAEGHAALALILANYEWNWTEAEREFRRALELHPSAAETRVAYASHLSRMGRLSEAEDEVRAALQHDPVSLPGHAQLAAILYRARRYDDALAQLRAMTELDPHYPVIHLNRGLIYAAEARYAEAVDAFEQGRTLDSGSSDLLALLAYASARSGSPDRARALLVELQAKAAREYVHPYAIALVHMGLSNRDAVLEWLERGHAERSWMTTLIKVNPELDALRGDPRFEALVRRMNFPDQRGSRVEAAVPSS